MDNLRVHLLLKTMKPLMTVILILTSISLLLIGGIAGAVLYNHIQINLSASPIAEQAVFKPIAAEASLEPALEEVTSQIKALQEQVQSLEQEKAAIQAQAKAAPIVEQPLNTAVVSIPDMYNRILRDQTKLTLQNCEDVVNYAENQEDDFDDEVDDKKQDLAKLRLRLEEYNQDLTAAVANSDLSEIRRLNDKIDRTEDDIDGISEEIDDLKDDYSYAKRLRAKAEYACKRMQREF
ncbi:hypothetical protein HYU19_04255 [Candidatus Woesearchaeota archaeon]|nr:hypothetical protein [Candidatus Woesearchaeota archaeon]